MLDFVSAVREAFNIIYLEKKTVHGEGICDIASVQTWNKISFILVGREDSLERRRR